MRDTGRGGSSPHTPPQFSNKQFAGGPNTSPPCVQRIFSDLASVCEENGGRRKFNESSGPGSTPGARFAARGVMAARFPPKKGRFWFRQNRRYRDSMHRWAGLYKSPKTKQTATTTSFPSAAGSAMLILLSWPKPPDRALQPRNRTEQANSVVPANEPLVEASLTCPVTTK